MSLPPPRTPLAQRARALLEEASRPAGYRSEADDLLAPGCTDRLDSASVGAAFNAIMRAQGIAALDLLESLAATPPAELADAKDRCAAAAQEHRCACGHIRAVHDGRHHGDPQPCHASACPCPAFVLAPRVRDDRENHRLTADEAYAWAASIAQAVLRREARQGTAAGIVRLSQAGHALDANVGAGKLRDIIADILAEIPAAPLPPSFGTPPDERLRQAADAVAATITEEGDAIHIGAGFWPAFRVLRAALDGPPVRPYQPEPERRVLPVPIVDDPLGSPAQPPPSWADLDAAATARAAHLLGQAAVLPPGPMRAALERQAASALASRGSSAHKERAMRRYLGGR